MLLIVFVTRISLPNVAGRVFLICKLNAIIVLVRKLCTTRFSVAFAVV